MIKTDCDRKYIRILNREDIYKDTRAAKRQLGQLSGRERWLKADVNP
ncbi:MAG: hypothetical protein LDL41_00840 [Coleofasciculus sp. S288]|nr:hypothetical protein [Coleofasciculus sp. S288]